MSKRNIVTLNQSRKLRNLKVNLNKHGINIKNMTLAYKEKIRIETCVSTLILRYKINKFSKWLLNSQPALVVNVHKKLAKKGVRLKLARTVGSNF